MIAQNKKPASVQAFRVILASPDEAKLEYRDYLAFASVTLSLDGV